ncbi:phosphotransferase [candidate division WOR-3 bacterium]|nr:phosphotransferase [candidate division WOR-3 bacterium]
MNPGIGKAKRHLALVYPELEVRTIELAGQGDFARAYTINNGLMVLFALNPEGSKSLAREAKLLPCLAKHVDLPIPNVSHSGQYGDNNYTFICYPRIPGISLSAKHFFDSSRKEQNRFAETISRFLHRLHSFDLDKARQAGIKERNYREENARYLEQSRELIYPLINQNVRDYIERQFETNAGLHFSPALVHDDLSAEHILFDPRLREITGIIDFSDMIIGDCIEDLMYLYDDFGVEFMDIFLEYYNDRDRNSLLESLRFYHARHTIARILWAVEHSYQPGIERRIKDLVDLVEASISSIRKITTLRRKNDKDRNSRYADR